MPIINKLIEIETEPKINIHNTTPQIKDFLASTSIKNGQVNRPRSRGTEKAHWCQLKPKLL
ncbi:MAG: hypothetical protein ACYTXY_46345 [Nostoc sp.]